MTLICSPPFLDPSCLQSPQTPALAHCSAPGQQLFGLVCEDGTVCFDHASQCRDDAGLQEPFHPHVYEVLLVLGR